MLTIEVLQSTDRQINPLSGHSFFSELVIGLSLSHVHKEMRFILNRSTDTSLKRTVKCCLQGVHLWEVRI